MQIQSTYGIFDHEGDHIIAMVHNHASLDAIVATPFPACCAKMVVTFNSDGTGFSLGCEGAPLHITKYQQIENPPFGGGSAMKCLRIRHGIGVNGIHTTKMGSFT